MDDDVRRRLDGLQRQQLFLMNHLISVYDLLDQVVDVVQSGVDSASLTEARVSFIEATREDER